MGRVVHFEIHAEDTKRAKEFYEGVFGWEITAWQGPMDYWLIKTGSAPDVGIDGAILKRRGSGPLEGAAVNGYVNTIDVANLDEFLTKVNEHKGRQVVEKMAIAHVGWLAYCQDTEGNIFGVMQADAGAE